MVVYANPNELKQCVWIVAMAACFVITAGTGRAVASASPQEQHEQDYSKNKNYKLGVRDGRDDGAKNRDHYKTRKFKKDQDQKAYDRLSVKSPELSTGLSTG